MEPEVFSSLSTHSSCVGLHLLPGGHVVRSDTGRKPFCFSGLAKIFQMSSGSVSHI